MNMKKIILFILTALLVASCGCDDDNQNDSNPQSLNKILYLQVRYSDNQFMGGTSYVSSNSSALITQNEYQQPNDLGSLKVYEFETNMLLFESSIIWAGVGERFSPEELNPSSEYEFVLSEDYVTPSSFEEIWESPITGQDVQIPWSAIQGLVDVRQKIAERENLEVQYFLFTPSVGMVDTNKAYWVFLIK